MNRQKCKLAAERHSGLTAYIYHEGIKNEKVTRCHLTVYTHHLIIKVLIGLLGGVYDDFRLVYMVPLYIFLTFKAENIDFV
jgi:hypothetical protein